jgi:hypothetical protein
MTDQNESGSTDKISNTRVKHFFNFVGQINIKNESTLHAHQVVMMAFEFFG